MRLEAERTGARRTQWMVLTFLAMSTAAWASEAAEAKANRCVSDCDCPAGQLCTPRKGICEAVFCTEEYKPVCGLDGNPYSNKCLADAAHVVVANDGPCAKKCGGIAGLPCEGKEFCQQATGLCAVDGLGRCEKIPEICPSIYQPVCGCDGKTYSNDCVRRRAGVSKLWEHACPVSEPEREAGAKASVFVKVCGSNADCSPSEFCFVGDGFCGSPSGLCVPRPEICFQVLLPVCGCDGNSYSNACFAHQAGVAAGSEGECPRE